ncbi:hypothetical protein ACEWY4_002719 [Coilia grayii]|uniref:Tantalus-like domain-containing protein n=1 Tax=Coilia grayii TaxID=363190 RepID=A0ABD1KPA9_9TELE
MLTSPTELLPQIVRPVERDVKASPSTLCIPHDMESKPQIASHSTVSSSCDDGDAQPEHRRSKRLQASPKGCTGDKTKPKVCKATSKQSQITSASVKKEGRRRGESCGDENVAVSKSLERKGLRGHRCNMALHSAKTQADRSSERSMQELESCDMAKDQHTPESPTAAKSWVIGPLFHSFKSKMASFTEIVMSPVRLFKPTDTLPSDAAGMCDGEALSFGKAANNSSSSSSDSVLSQQVHESRRLQIYKNATKGAEDSKFKTECLEKEWNFASSNLTRSALCRGEGPSQPDPVTSGTNQSVLLGPNDPSSSNNVLERQALQRRPQIRQIGQNKTSSDDARKTNAVSSAESVACGETAVLPHRFIQSKSGDEQLDDRMGRLSESSVFDTPPDSFSNADGTSEKEDLEESTPVQHTRIRSSPRKPSRGTSFTPAPCNRANGRQKGTGKKVTFGKEVKVEDDSEEEGVRAECQSASSDEEMSPPEADKSSPEAESAQKRLQRVDRKRIRKPQEVDPEWGETAKRRLKAGRAERATRKKGKNKDMVKKECLSEWLETSEDILFTKTTRSLVADSGTNPLESSHESSADIDKSGIDASEAALKFEGSSRLTRRQAKSKQSTPDTVNVDPLENEYTDCFTDHLAVSFYADKSHNDSSIGGRENENSLNASLPRKNRQRAKKPAVLTAVDDRSLMTNNTTLKSEDDGSSVFSPNMENSSGSLLSSTVLSQSMNKSGRKRRLMKTPSQMFGDDLPDDSPSATVFKLDNTISEMRGEKRSVGEEKRSRESVEETCRDGSTDEGQNTPSKRGCPRALKRKSPSPSTKESHVDGSENSDEDCGAFVDAEEPPEAPASGSGSNRLLRSYSCPEIASLSHHEQPWRSPTLPSHGRALRPPAPHHRSIPHQHQPAPHLPHSPSKRARRHTVCSLEIAREIAPLCLRKEVYPTGRGGLYGSPSHPLCPSTASPSTSFTALVSSFLSSPLAFLSRRSDRGKRKVHSDDGLSSSSSSSSFSPSVSLTHLSPPLTFSSAAHHSPAGFTCIAPPMSSHFSHSLSPSGSSPSQDEDSGQQSEDGEESSCLSVEMLSTEIPEEKALSDSEIKMETRQGEQGKVSSIRIRKTLPKPLNNLTPMGLPKLIRPKKKEFSVEEIYTNKNFTKPAEGRLETIFEVPLKRRDGSHCLLGQRRVKRFVEFPELGKVRKVRKPLVGVGSGSSGAQKKTPGGGQPSGGRPRRGAWSASKDDQHNQHPSPKDLDSLLCSKLNQLDTFMAEDECSS